MYNPDLFSSKVLPEGIIPISDNSYGKIEVSNKAGKAVQSKIAK